MTSRHDWRHEIRTRASHGTTLPEATVEEIAEHLDDIYTGALSNGASPDDALTKARHALEESTFDVLRRRASSTHAPRETIEPAGGRSLNLAGALQFALRQLRVRPGFFALTILVLALGIGASTAVFTIVDSVLLRPLPYAEPDRLVTLWDTNAGRGLTHETVSPVNFMDYRALSVFAGAAAWWRPSVNLLDPGLDPVRVNAIEVSGNLFDVLGVRPQLGEGFPVGGAFFVRNEPLIVISDRLWRSRYGADPSIVGRPLRVNGVANIVAGVMPPRFHYPDDVDVWQRLGWDLAYHSRAAHFMEAVARLADGVTHEQAAIAAEALGQRLEAEFPLTKGWRTRLVPLLENQLGYYRPALLVLVGAVGLLLLIGCLNVASLVLTRALSREREVAVRVAIGASPRQLVAQLLAESLVLSTAGALVGVLAATIVLPALVALAPPGLPRLDEARVDVRALGLVIGIVALTTVIFGLVPALALLRGKGSIELRSGERGSSRRARRVYSALVAGQVALACTLLVSSALLVRTVVRMMDVPTGVDADEVVTTSVQLGSSSASQSTPYSEWQTITDQYASILERIRQQPGVIGAGATNTLPLEVELRMPYEIDGNTPSRADDRLIAQFHTVSDGYFESMKATIVAGRAFSTFDTYKSAPVVIVNEAFAARHREPGRLPLGRVISTNVLGQPLARNLMLPPPPPDLLPTAQPAGQAPPVKPVAFEVVGVVRDVRNTPLGQPVEPAIYFSAGQFPFRQMFLTTRAVDSPTAIRAVGTALAAVVPTVPVGRTQTWGETMASRTAEPRLLMTLLIFFGAAAGLLAALGVYGLFSWAVVMRTRELAIRLTLGARPASVGASVLRQSLALIAIGLFAGFIIIRLAERTLARVLFEMSPRDPPSFVAAGLLLLVVALAACLPPALRALRVDPVHGLRAE